MPGCRSLQMPRQIFLVVYELGASGRLHETIFPSSDLALLPSPSPLAFFLEYEFLKPEGAGKGEAGTDLQGSWKQKG